MHSLSSSFATFIIADALRIESSEETLHDDTAIGLP